MINVRLEVEAILGRKMTHHEYVIYNSCRECGYANPIDIVREITK